MTEVPYADLETLFLDAGNTLICMNFEWVAEELRALGVDADAASLRRAEAAARPATSARIASMRTGDDHDLFLFHLTGMLTRLQAQRRGGRADWPALAVRLCERIKSPGRDYRLWSWVLPGVPEALRRLRALGLKLVVVSNSDGSVARALEELGLSVDLDAVFDSHVVGYEKPDPRFFAHALELSGSSAARTAHVGDMYCQDVQGSRAAGLHSVLLDPYGDWEIEDCARCRDLPELAARIAGAHGDSSGIQAGRIC